MLKFDKKFGINKKDSKRYLKIGGYALLAIFLLYFFETYIPVSPRSASTVQFIVEKGWGSGQVAKNLEKEGLIRSSLFFNAYSAFSMKRFSLQAGKYNLSPKMSAYQIAKKIANGDVVKSRLVILEGWDEQKIGKYLEEKGICAPDEFTKLVLKDYSGTFDFLKEKPADAGLEGFLFPDTYEISGSENCENAITMMLSNFEKKLEPGLREEIAKQNKSIFSIITMASLIEKEVRVFEEKKIVSGILWKRLGIGMPLQLDATVNYITGKNDPGVAIKDTKVDSPYNTYMYKGLPRGPISSPGMESLIAAIYPAASKYWFYLSSGKTYFSETLDQHNIAKAKYLD